MPMPLSRREAALFNKTSQTNPLPVSSRDREGEIQYQLCFGVALPAAGGWTLTIRNNLTGWLGAL
jgi:hypothetical protein